MKSKYKDGRRGELAQVASLSEDAARHETYLIQESPFLQ